ncbi:MAG: patatin-like phospholipase family protein [Betaproteobacteria bacterium]|nr:patatin-like phospholipase family protein [Betaproteobacteria bacterium]
MPASAPLPAALPADRRPRIGLVLGGGGARGAAHVGVLEVLERLRVPVDCVAGTSMGALVAGAFASGLTSAQMRAELGSVDWFDLFQDNPPYNETVYRSKQLARRYLPGSELGIGAGGPTAPPGVLTGQKIKLFFNRLVRADRIERSIDSLSMPLAIIATDIGTGDRVVLRDGSLTLAMRASMSVPGLMAPVEYRERKLVDGGLVDNLPVAEVRRLCRPDVVIAVNVGSPLLAPSEVGSLLSVTAQMVNILTEQNVTQSMAELGAQDIYIRPPLEGITAGDFDKHATAAERGQQAANAVEERLRALSVDEAAYQAWRTRILDADRLPPQVDAIEIAGLRRTSPQAMTRHISQQTGQPLETGTLNRDLLRAYGEGHYQSIDYTLLRERDRTILRLAPLEKSWGPDYLRFAVNLDTSLGTSATYSLRAAYHRTALNGLGGELLLGAEAGTAKGMSADFYQPIEPSQTWFVEPRAWYRSRPLPVYQDNRRLAEYLTSTLTSEVAVGANLGLIGQARLGVSTALSQIELTTGSPLLIEQNGRSSGWFASLDLDQLDRLYAPTRGWATRVRYFESTYSQFGQPYSKLSAEGRAAWPLGSFVMLGQLSWVGSTRGQLPVTDAAQLGGFLRLSAFAQSQLIGDDVTYGRIGLERILGRLPLGLRGDVRAGVSVESARFGRLYTERQRSGALQSGVVYLGSETPLGPVYVGFAYAPEGGSKLYLFLGLP